jgi:hypothetical protein
LATKEVDCLLLELWRGFHLDYITVSVNHSGRGFSILAVLPQSSGLAGLLPIAPIAIYVYIYKYRIEFPSKSTKSCQWANGRCKTIPQHVSHGNPGQNPLKLS